MRTIISEASNEELLLEISIQVFMKLPNKVHLKHFFSFSFKTFY